MTFIAWYFNGQSILGIDDANIYKIYMRNFANGDGFVYNVNSERVEGFTSFLWTLIGAFYYFVGFNLDFSLLITCTFLTSLTLYVSLKFMLNNLQIEKSILINSCLFFAFFCLIPGYFEWNILSLMENALWTFLNVAILLKIVEFDFSSKNEIKKIKILLVLLLLCRPEAYFFALIYIFILFIIHFIKSKNIINSFKFCVSYVLIYIITILFLTLFRKLYFSFYLPNTFYAKVSFDWFTNLIIGYQYIIDYLNFNILLFLSFCFYLIYTLIFLINFKKKRNSYLLMLLVLFCVLSLIPIFLSGGDHFRLGRFFQYFMPIYALSFVLIINNLLIRNQFVIFGLLIFFAGLYSPFTNLDTYKSKRTPLTVEWEIASKSKEIANYFSIFFKDCKKMPTQGVLTAGAQAYFYTGETIDLMGLNNTKIAHVLKIKNRDAPKNHASFNKEIFYYFKPDLFLFSCELIDKNKAQSLKNVELNDFHKKAFLNLQNDEKFREHYNLLYIEKKKFKKGILVFVSNEFMKELEINKYQYRIITYS